MAMTELIRAAEALLPQLESNLRSNAPAFNWGITMTVPEMQRMRDAIAAAKAAPAPRGDAVAELSTLREWLARCPRFSSETLATIEAIDRRLATLRAEPKPAVSPDLRDLVVAANRMREDWAESTIAGQNQLWSDLHAAAAKFHDVVFPLAEPKPQESPSEPEPSDDDIGIPPLTLADVLEGEAQVARGETVTLDELRAELRAEPSDDEAESLPSRIWHAFYPHYRASKLPQGPIQECLDEVRRLAKERDEALALAQIEADARREQVDTVKQERDEWKRECEGYKLVLKNWHDDENKTVVVLVWGETEMRVYGPDPDREKAMAESVAHYIKLVDVVATSMELDEARAKLAAAESHIEVLKTSYWARDVKIVPELKAKLAAAEANYARCAAGSKSLIEDYDAKLKTAEARVAELEAEGARLRAMKHLSENLTGDEDD